MIPTSSTTVSRGGNISYTVTVYNTGTTSQTVNASVVAVYPNGGEAAIATRTVTVPAGATLSQGFSLTVPFGVPLGEYQLAGRAEIPSTSYDEDIELYTVAP